LTIPKERVVVHKIFNNHEEYEGDKANKQFQNIEVAEKALEDAQSKVNTHRVLSFDRRSTRFLI